MKIIHSSSTWPPKYGEFKDSVVIYDDRWNDFSYRTSFFAVYCDKNGEVSEIGAVKIYYYDYDKDRTDNYGSPVSGMIGSGEIFQLPEKYCSLGQSLNYYQTLKELLPNDYFDILKRLNDIAIFPEIREKFIYENGVQVSLLRESSAEKALNEAADVLRTNELRQKDMSFKYLATPPYASKAVELDFNFRFYENMPYRINILIGKNGTGKTQILTSLANSLSGVSDRENARLSMFVDSRPPVDKVISISYSAFDAFKKRPTNDNYKSNSYVYCGIQSEQGTLSLRELNDNFRNAFAAVKEKKRLDSWKAVMSELVEPEHVNLVERTFNSGDISDIHWSSGQNILICTITEALANIERESILLFDEPELHLHPNAVANVMRMLYRLLEEFDSYAIFATHSPLIVQETPSRYIQILNRVDNVLIVKRPVLECFGENVTSITNDIFDVTSAESNYKTVLKRLRERMSYEEVLALFDGKLSFNAMIYLKNCLN